MVDSKPYEAAEPLAFCWFSVEEDLFLYIVRVIYY